MCARLDLRGVKATKEGGFVLTVLCCSNDSTVLEGVLLRSLEGYHEHRLLLWQNDRTRNVPIPEAYNRLAVQAEGDWLVFVHQDVRFLPGALTLLESKLQSLQADWGPVGLVGLAGATADGWLHNGGVEPCNYRGFHIGVQTLDECLFACIREMFEQIGGFAEGLP